MSNTIAPVPEVQARVINTTQEEAQRNQLERNARLIALLDKFEAGDVERQREDLAILQANLDADRPGQRRVFAPGANP